ncbi:MAG: MgtC/SapB family protein [Bacteroidia bacterium]|nr:MgtC/SapB family protein [Bacteroidia bacterium]
MELIPIQPEYALRLLLSFAVGFAIGFEREYRSKAAGLRTILMICFGSTVFTIVSVAAEGGSDVRIAANIITGIGFLGAGVIFKDGLTVTGLTTASTIWIAAALGMAIGFGQYYVAIVSSGIVLAVLTLLEKFTLLIERLHQVRNYKITIKTDNFQVEFENELAGRKLKFRRKRDVKIQAGYYLVYDVAGNEKKLDQLDHYLKTNSGVSTYEY